MAFSLRPDLSARPGTPLLVFEVLTRNDNEDGCIRRAALEYGLVSGRIGPPDTIPLNEPRERPGYGICKQRLDQWAGRTSGRTETEGHQRLEIVSVHAGGIN